VVGATQPPDVAMQSLERAATIDGLEQGLSLEDVLIALVSFRGSNAGSVRVERSHLRDVDLGDARLRALSMVDTTGERVDAANGDWSAAKLRRVLLEDSRLTGLSLAETHLEEVQFKCCKLDYVNFRNATIEHVSFEDCSLLGADFQGATIHATRFAGCKLLETDFSRAQMESVDLRGSQLKLAGSMLALKGTTIDSLQLIDIAPLLALELGIAVEPDQGSHGLPPSDRG
jgi:uncharacterized protein YjbI with pentapeptide repeats